MKAVNSSQAFSTWGLGVSWGAFVYLILVKSEQYVVCQIYNKIFKRNNSFIRLQGAHQPSGNPSRTNTWMTSWWVLMADGSLRRRLKVNPLELQTAHTQTYTRTQAQTSTNTRHLTGDSKCQVAKNVPPIKWSWTGETVLGARCPLPWLMVISVSCCSTIYSVINIARRLSTGRCIENFMYADWEREELDFTL